MIRWKVDILYIYIYILAAKVVWADSRNWIVL